MKLEDILKLDPAAQVGEFLNKTGVDIKRPYELCRKEYTVSDHDIFDLAKRKDKQVLIKDSKGQPTAAMVSVARIGLAMQELIVDRGVAFLIGKGINYNADDTSTDNLKQVVSIHSKILKDNKMRYRDRQIARILNSECEVAELWYLDEAGDLWDNVDNLDGSKFTLKSKILANSKGDWLYPHFDEYGKMDAFGRKYQIITAIKEQWDYFDIYTADRIYKYKIIEGEWVLDPDIAGNPLVNSIGKVPVIYYWQPRPDWWKVETMIERLETLLSNHADTNDYYGNPILTVNGEVQGLGDKGENGKVFQLSKDGKAQYLSWDNAPASVKLEIDNLINFIYSLTQTPDISFSQMKALGNISGVALKLMFIDPILKAMSKEETFGEMVQRRTNLILYTIGKVIATKLVKECNSIEIEPEFTPFLPSNDVELVAALYTATGNKAFLSQETAVKISPFTQDPDNEIEVLQNEESAVTEALAGSFNLPGPAPAVTQPAAQSTAIK